MAGCTGALTLARENGRMKGARNRRQTLDFNRMSKCARPDDCGSRALVNTATTRPTRYRLGMAATDKITVSLDASIVAQAREQIGEPVAGLADDAVIERAINAYLLRRMVDTTQLAAGLSEEEAERVVCDEVLAARRERPSST